MKLNKKYFLPLTTLLIHVFFGINFTYAACEKEVSDYCTHSNSSGKPDFYSGCVKAQENTIEEEVERVLREEESKTENKAAARAEARRRLIDSIKYSESGMSEKNPTFRIISVMKFCQLKESLNLFDSRNQGKTAYSETVSNQSSSSGTSSNQSSSAAQSNSPESYNIQVSQTNKQNYQAVQRAYEQANAGKGKKNNLQAVGTECMKNNPSQKSFTNKCNQAINFAYCFSGIVPGYKNENPETLAEMSCQNGQFGTLTLGAGESIPGSYRGMVLEGLACKSPSQPVGMKYNTSEPANGRCSY